MIFGSQIYNQILLFHLFFAELLRNLRSSILIFLVTCFPQDMDNREIISFAVHYRNNMKIIKSIISVIAENIKSKFQSYLGFTQQLRLQLEHQDCDIFNDLNEPVQLIERSSNVHQYVIADDKADDADKITSITSSFESDDTV